MELRHIASVHSCFYLWTCLLIIIIHSAASLMHTCTASCFQYINEVILALVYSHCTIKILKTVGMSPFYRCRPMQISLSLSVIPQQCIVITPKAIVVDNYDEAFTMLHSDSGIERGEANGWYCVPLSVEAFVSPSPSVQLPISFLITHLSFLLFFRLLRSVMYVTSYPPPWVCFLHRCWILMLAQHWGPWKKCSRIAQTHSLHM